MINHPDDDDRLTLGELSIRAKRPVHELQKHEANGVIHRSDDDLFPALESIKALAEARIAAMTWSDVSDQLALWPEYLFKLSLREVLRLVLRSKRFMRL